MKFRARLFWLVALAALLSPPAMADKYPSVYPTLAAIPCSTEIACTNIAHVQISAATTFGTAGLISYDWYAVGAGFCVGSYYRPSGSATGCFVPTRTNINSVAGLGTGIATALATSIGSAGAPVVSGGAGGTPSSITLTNASGMSSTQLTDTLTIVHRVSDMATLKLQTGATMANYRTQILSGYRGPGTPGGGLFVWNSAGCSYTVADVDMCITPSDGGVGRLERALNGAPSEPYMFSAYGDNSNDDYSALSRMTAFACGAVGSSKQVYLSSGTFKLNGTLNYCDSLTITGAGMGVSRLVESGSNIPVFQNADWATGAAGQKVNVAFRDFAIGASASNTGAAVNWYNTWSSQMTNIQIDTESGRSFTKCIEAKVYNNGGPVAGGYYNRYQNIWCRATGASSVGLDTIDDPDGTNQPTDSIVDGGHWTVGGIAFKLCASSFTLRSPTIENGGSGAEGVVIGGATCHRTANDNKLDHLYVEGITGLYVDIQSAAFGNIVIADSSMAHGTFADAYDGHGGAPNRWAGPGWATVGFTQDYFGGTTRTYYIATSAWQWWSSDLSADTTITVDGTGAVHGTNWCFRGPATMNGHTLTLTGFYPTASIPITVGNTWLCGVYDKERSAAVIMSYGTTPY